MDYNIKKSIDKITRGEFTDFLDPLEYKLVISKLKKNEYLVFNLYEDADKKILYTSNVPQVHLYKIICKGILRHQDILGALLSLNVDSSIFGDIVVDDNNYYICVVDRMANFIKTNLLMIGRNIVTLEEVSIDTLNYYNKKYEAFSTIVPSLRIDAILSKIIGDSRKNILEKIKNKEIILNYEIVKNNSFILKENDVFSVRKSGKYKFSKVIKSTKKDNLVIEYFKYI